MKYIHVASGAIFSDKPLNTDEAVVGITDSCLISLIGGLRQAEFGYDTMFNVIQDIRKYRRRYMVPWGRRLFIDSGGYSFIKGDIRPQDAMKAIGCYRAYLESERNVYDYIFSLDLPISLKYSSFNTVDNLYHLNRASLVESLEVMERHPEIRDKFYFVWHFKIPTQYQVWKRIHAELDLDGIVGGRALGGMVSIRGLTKITFSPFIGMAYRCLYDYLAAEKFNIPFRLHFLGVYLPYDRFQIAFLEALFRQYLEGIADVEFTYDSIYYSETPRRKVKSLSVFEYAAGEPRIYQRVVDVPDDALIRVYGEPQKIEAVKAEMDRLSKGKKLADINAFIPLYMRGCVDLDRYFEDLIDKYQLVDAFFTCRHIIPLKRRFNNLLTDQAKLLPDIFTKGMVASIIKNLEFTYKLHWWFMNRMDYESLDRLVCAFINMIGFQDSIK